MRILYDIVYCVFLVFYLPFFLVRRKMHPDFSMRLGFFPAGWSFRSPVWIHAVSVGEMAAMRPLVVRLRREYPGQQLFLTTVTPTGNKIARSLAADGDHVAYLPLDLSFLVRRVIERIKPRLVIIAETEFWPNLLNGFARRDIPVVIVNGRISDRSMPKYRLIRRLVGPLLSSVKMFCMQSDKDAGRLVSLGVDPRQVHTCGNLKFDLDWPQADHSQRQDRRRDLGLNSDELLWVAASTHAGEEEVIARVYRQLTKDFPRLRLVIAPRHPERSSEVSAAVIRSGFQPRLCSAAGKGQVFNQPSAAAVLDTVGRLLDYYALADIVFVGGSLVPVGGHNILEPAYFGRPVVFGSHMHNFRDIEKLFLAGKAAVRVADEAELLQAMRCLLRDPAQAASMGVRARDLVQKNQGAAGSTMRLIKEAAVNRKESYA